MTFDRYLDYIGTPENLAREAGWWRGSERMDWTGPLRHWYETLRLRDDQVAAIRWSSWNPSMPHRWDPRLSKPKKKTKPKSPDEIAAEKLAEAPHLDGHAETGTSIQ